MKGCFCHFNGYEVKDAKARRDIEQLANNQIPAEYLQASVDEYIEENDGGLATKEDLEELDNKLSSEIANKQIATLSDTVFKQNILNLSNDTDGYIKENGEYQYQPSWHFYNNYVEVMPNTRYYRLVNSEYEQVVFYGKNKEFLSVLKLYADNTYFETPNNAYFVMFQATKTQADYATQVYSVVPPTEYVEPNTNSLYVPYEIITTKKQKIVGYGDSMVQSTGATSGNDIITLLGKMANMDYVNRGKGSATTEEVMAIIGCLPLYIEPFTLPASKDTLVNISVKNILGNSVRPMGGVCTINGIRCYFSGVSQDLSNLQIARQESGEAVTFDRPIPIMYDGISNKGNVMILWYGNNDGYGVSDFEEWASYTDMAISYNGNQDFLVIGLTSLTWTPEAVAFNAKAQKKYGDKFVNVRDWLINYGLDYCKIAPTEQDTTDISNNEIPTSLRADIGHLNNNGCKCAAKCLYDRGVTLGYWK